MRMECCASGKFFVQLAQVRRRGVTLLIPRVRARHPSTLRMGVQLRVLRSRRHCVRVRQRRLRGVVW